VPHVREQRLIAQTQRMRDKGVSYSKIADHLNDRGIKTPQGKSRWYGCVIRGILLG